MSMKMEISRLQTQLDEMKRLLEDIRRFLKMPATNYDGRRDYAQELQEVTPVLKNISRNMINKGRIRDVIAGVVVYTGGYVAAKSMDTIHNNKVKRDIQKAMLERCQELAECRDLLLRSRGISAMNLQKRFSLVMKPIVKICRSISSGKKKLRNCCAV